MSNFVANSRNIFLKLINLIYRIRLMYFSRIFRKRKKLQATISFHNSWIRMKVTFNYSVTYSAGLPISLTQLSSKLLFQPFQQLLLSNIHLQVLLILHNPFSKNKSLRTEPNKPQQILLMHLVISIQFLFYS